MVFSCAAQSLEENRHVTIIALQSSWEEVQIIPPCFWKKLSYYTKIYDPQAEIDDDSQTMIACYHEQARKILYVLENVDRLVFQ